MRYSAKDIAAIRCPIICVGTILAMLIVSAVPAQAVVSNNSYSLTFSTDGRLSLNAHGVPLEKILAHIKAKTKLTYHLCPEHREKSIYVSFRSLSVYEAIKKILHGINYACILDPNDHIQKIITFSNTGKWFQAPSDHQSPSKRFSSGAEPMPQQDISTEDASSSHQTQPPSEVIKALEEDIEPVPPPDMVGSEDEEKMKSGIE